MPHIHKIVGILSLPSRYDNYMVVKPKLPHSVQGYGCHTQGIPRTFHYILFRLLEIWLRKDYRGKDKYQKLSGLGKYFDQWRKSSSSSQRGNLSNRNSFGWRNHNTAHRYTLSPLHISHLGKWQR